MRRWTLYNRKALVTGGTKGIGRATVHELAALGAEVLFTARNEKDVQQTEAECKKEGFNVTGIVLDISEENAAQTLKLWIENNWNSLDVLVNNAGTNIRKRTEDYSDEDYNIVINTNITAPFRITKALLPLLQNAGSASVINVASVAGIMDVRTGSPYGISKAGLIQFTRNLAVEWAKYDIRVNAVSPWMTKTPLTENLLSDKEKQAQVMQRTPLSRVARGEEMATVIAFLAMPASSYITGQNIIVDGGMSVSAL